MVKRYEQDLVTNHTKTRDEFFATCQETVTSSIRIQANKGRRYLKFYTSQLTGTATAHSTYQYYFGDRLRTWLKAEGFKVKIESFEPYEVDYAIEISW